MIGQFATGLYGRPSPPKIQGCQIDQQIQSWSKDQLQDRIANKGMAWPNYRRLVFLRETEHPKNMDGSAK